MSDDDLRRAERAHASDPSPATQAAYLRAHERAHGHFPIDVLRQSPRVCLRYLHILGLSIPDWVLPDWVRETWSQALRYADVRVNPHWFYAEGEVRDG